MAISFVSFVSAVLLPLLVGAVQTAPTRRCVAVAGSTGRVGRLVVNELLNNENYVVKALTRDLSKAKRILPQSESIQLVKCDLSDASQVSRAFRDVDAIIWCASGFSADSNWYDKLLSLFKLKFTPTKTIEMEGIRFVANALKQQQPQVENEEESSSPRFILCSSAGVTRPSWSEEKKKAFVGAADIPIVRLNPFNILNLKLQGEDVLRSSGVPYCIVRPCGLNDNWPTGRPILSQGDVAVGRSNKESLARFMVKLLDEPQAASKTFECFTLPNYPEPRSYQDQLSRLRSDGEALEESTLAAEYALLQQLVPGETLAPNQLAMGQTYEQLDKGQTGRLGKRKFSHFISLLPHLKSLLECTVGGEERLAEVVV